MTWLALVVALFWVAVLANTVANVTLLPRLRGSLSAETGPRVSVIIPARNEASVISRTLSCFSEQTYSELEIILVDDRSTDGTGEIADRHAAADARVRVIRGVDTPEGWLGKPWALRQGSLAATGEWLLFVDADLVYVADTIARLVARAEAEPATAMWSVFPHIEMKGLGENLLMPQLALMPFSFLPTWLGNRTTSRTLAVGGGTGNFVRRTAYDAIGGHERLRNAVIDDVGLARALRAGGFRTEMIRAEEFVSLRMYIGAGEIIAGFTKNLYTALGGSIASALGSFAFMMLFHLAPYIACALWLVRGGAVGNASPWFAAVIALTLSRVILFRSLRFSQLNALFGYPLSTVVWGWMVLRSAWFSGVRRRIEWRGRSYPTVTTRFGGE